VKTEQQLVEHLKYKMEQAAKRGKAHEQDLRSGANTVALWFVVTLMIFAGALTFWHFTS